MQSKESKQEKREILQEQVLSTSQWKPVEDIELLDQELDAGGDKQVGQVVAVDL